MIRHLKKLFRTRQARMLRDMGPREEKRASVLEEMASFELEQRPIPRSVAAEFNDLLLSAAGRRELAKTAMRLSTQSPQSLLTLYAEAMGRALAGEVVAAYELINNAQASQGAGACSRSLHSAKRLNEIWLSVDAVAQKQMLPAALDKPRDRGRGRRPTEPLDAAEMLAAGQKLLMAQRHDAYLDVCKAAFDAAETLALRIRAVRRMIRTTRRRLPSYQEAYRLARECFEQTKPEWESLLRGAEAEPSLCDSELARVELLADLFNVALRLELVDDKRLLLGALIATADVGCSDVRWMIAAALAEAFDPECHEQAAQIAPSAREIPNSPRVLAACFRWARETGNYQKAHEVYACLPKKTRRLAAVLPYVDILEREAQYGLAAQMAREVAAEMVRKPYKMSYRLHAQLCVERINELMFFHDTAELYQRVPQPKRPKGVVFVAGVNFRNLRRCPFVVLMELKRQGWAVVPLVEGLLPHQPTGDREIDQFAQCVNARGELRSPEKGGFAPVEGVESELSLGRLGWKGLDLSHALWEEATIRLRRYSIDFRCPALLAWLRERERWVRSYLSVAEEIRKVMAEKGLPAGFFVTDVHRLPNAVFRHYCDRFGDATKLFCAQGSNAYENYFKNFSTNVSTTYATRNLTAFKHMRAAFLPEPSEFARWYAENRHRAHEMLAEVESITRMRRSTGEESERLPEAAACLQRIDEWRRSGGKVAALFGKVVADLAVPYDGGPAHASMKDWLNHTVAAVRGSDTLLLIKPHPHEMNNDIGRFLSEYFLDLIEGPLPDNVVVLGHRWFDMQDLQGRIDVGLLYNGTTAVELGVMGIPAVLCAAFGPIDYPVGHAVPSSRAHYERLVRFEAPVEVSGDLPLRCAAWLHYMSSELVSVPYRYHARQVTNRILYPPWWFLEDVEAYLREGDPHVERLAARIIGPLESTQP